MLLGIVVEPSRSFDWREVCCKCKGPEGAGLQRQNDHEVFWYYTLPDISMI